MLNIILQAPTSFTIFYTQKAPLCSASPPLCLTFRRSSPASHLQLLVSRPSLRIVPTLVRRPLRAHEKDTSPQKHAPGEREAHSCKALQRASTTDHGTPVNARRQLSTDGLDKQCPGVLFALTARVQVRRRTRPVSAKRTLTQDSSTKKRHRPRGGIKDAQGASRQDCSIKRRRGCASTSNGVAYLSRSRPSPKSVEARAP